MAKNDESKDVGFAVGKDGLEWFHLNGGGQLSTEQAHVVALMGIRSALSDVAGGLHAIADAIRDTARD